MARANIDYGALAISKPTRKKREPIGESGTLKVYKRMKVRNEERHAESHARQFGAQAAACRTLPCASCGKVPNHDEPTDPHHEPPVSLGGLDADTVPLCRRCHDLRGATTDRSFWAAVGLDPEDVKQAVRDWMGSPAYRSTR